MLFITIFVSWIVHEMDQI